MNYEKTIGFIGLGIMGQPMAKNLVKAGFSLVIHDILRERCTSLLSDEKVEEALSPKDVAEKAKTIITMLPNSPEVKEAVLGENGVLDGARAGAMLIDMSSIAPLVSQEIAAKCREKGVRMMDAPVSGGEPKAIDGTLAIMVGGDEKDFEEYQELLLIMGSSAVLVGEIGSGNTTKLANQILVALHLAAMSEALVLAKKAGVDPELMYNAVRGGLAGSTVLDAKVLRVLGGNLDPGFKIDLHIKDLANVLETSHQLDVSLPLTSLVMEEFLALKADGKGDLDHSGIIRFYENLSKIEVTGSKKQ